MPSILSRLVRSPLLASAAAFAVLSSSLVAQDTTLYATDGGGKVYSLDTTTEQLDWTTQLPSGGEQGIAVDSAGNVYISKRFSWRVDRVDADGNLLTPLVDDTVGGTRFDRIAIGPDSRLWITGNGRMPRYELDGTRAADFLPAFGAVQDVAFGSQGQVYILNNTAAGWAIEQRDGNDGSLVATLAVGPFAGALEINAAGELYVESQAGGGGYEIRRYSPNGDLLATFGQSSAGSHDMAIDGEGNLHVTRFQQPVIDVYSSDGAYLRTIGDGNYSRRIAFKTAASNSPPTAVAGDDQSIRAGDPVILDGTQSFDDNTASQDLQYGWQFTSVPTGSTAVLVDSNTATPSFVADVAGSYTVSLVVTDEGGLASAPDEVVISSDNLAPSADAGPDTVVILGELVLLSGSGSDPEGDAVDLEWTITAAPAGSSAALADATTANPSFTPDLVGVYVIELVASDFLGPGAPDTVEVTVITAEEFAEQEIVGSAGIVETLVPGQVTTGGNQNALTNFLGQALLAIEEGDLAEAIDKLEKAIARTDGCALRGAPDGNGPGRDWITDCAAQVPVYDALTAALEALTE